MLQVETDREEDGRWIAEIAELPGVLAYGATREEAIERAKALSLRVIADWLEHGEVVPISSGGK
jgi:predicted RNase H-like HicB family nuclease